MQRSPHPKHESPENDPVWKLLAQAPSATASPSFADDTLRAARLQGQQESWWKRLLTPAPIAGLATAAAVLTVSLMVWPAPETTPPGNYAVTNTDAVVDSPQADEIEEIAQTEALIAAIDHIDDFSDTELVALIGF